MRLLKRIGAAFCGLGVIVYTTFLFTEDQSLFVGFLFMDALMMFFLYLLLRKPTHQEELSQIATISSTTKDIQPSKLLNKIPNIDEQSTIIPKDEYNISMENEKIFSSIPDSVLELLWFRNGPFKNCDADEPSAINVELPLQVDTNPQSAMLDIGYYPNYIRLSPQERYLYLSWLCDMNKPIAIGYAFIFYYGLERYLFTDKYEKALKMIAVLRSMFAENNSFRTYSTDAILIACAIHNRMDLLPTLLDAQEPPNATLFLVRAYIQKSLSVQDIMANCTMWGFTNKRYINGQPDLFLAQLQERIFDRYGQADIPISDEDYRQASQSLPVVLANYSLKTRVASLKDVSTSPPLRETVCSLLTETHEAVKNTLRCNRKSADDSAPITQKSTPTQPSTSSVVSDPDLQFLISNVRYSTIPHEDVPFSRKECAFFLALVQKCREANFDPREIRLTRMASMGFNVDTCDGYIGKINLHTTPDRYAVKKKEAKRAYKIFDHLADAEAFIAAHTDYSIEVRKGINICSMQYVIGLFDAKNLDDLTIEQCIANIPHWIKQMKYCKRSNSP